MKEEIFKMSLQVEKKEHNMAVLTIEVGADKLDEAIEKAYRKQKNSISIPGFRKGKVPRQMIERMYGKGVFYEEAADILIPDSYSETLEANKELEVVSQPKIDVVQIEQGKPFIFTAEVALKPDVVLGQYKGVEVPKPDTEVTEEDINAALKAEQEKNSRTVQTEDKIVKADDIITLDFEGFIDGKPFQGGKSENYPLTIGSGSFIPGFEEQLIGAEVDKELEVKVKFPDDYANDDVKGKDAVFMCLVHSISRREIPELNDEFASNISEFETLDEYKADLTKKLQEKKNAEAKKRKENDAVDKVIENSEMDIPQPMIDLQVRQTIEDFARRMQQQGLSLEQYMQFTGMDEDKLREQAQPEALKRIQSSLVLEAIVKAENIETSEDRVEDEIKKMAESYQIELDKFQNYISADEREQIKKDLAMQDALTLVADQAVETEEAKDSKETESDNA